MALKSGTNLGPYEILSPLGAGGMGEVYRARDTRLDREVAIKMLPARLSHNDEFLKRFQREARVISSLTHPNICTLHDVGEHDGSHFLVMELIEGETLAQRIARGPLPPAEFLRIGTEIAAALDKAHRAGIVHRDLKPGNVVLAKSGAKLLDFGLAKAAAGASDASSAADAVTLTEPLTGKDTILGTIQYMAPEQLEAKEADARTDIFAFGTVLYEMATGKRAFSGSSRASLITSIMSSSPEPVSQVQPMSPPALDHLVRMCLAKDPEERIQTAHDVKLQLQWILEGGSVVGAPATVRGRRNRRERLAWLIASVAVIAALVSATKVFQQGLPKSEPIHADLMPPEGARFDHRAGPPAISPNGRMIVFAARSSDETHLWLRDLGQSTARRIEGTEDGRFPFWSPDSQSVAFFAGRHLKRVDVVRGQPDTICAACRPEVSRCGGGGAWNRDNVIVFAAGNRGDDGLKSVSAYGGQPAQVTTLDKSTNEFAHRYPCFLRDGRRFLFSTRRGIGGENGVSIGSLDGSPPQRVLEVNSNAVYVEPGYVLYWRDGAVRAQSFDHHTQTVTGAPVRVASEVRYEPADTIALFSVSANGVLVYHQGQSATDKSQLVLRDRTGTRVGTVGLPGNYYAPRFSHDGRFVVVDNSGVQNNGDIWIYGVDSESAIRVTSDPADESRPIWSPADNRIAFLSGKSGPDSLFAKELGNLAVEQPLVVNDQKQEPTGWSADGNLIAFNQATSESRVGADIWVYSIADNTAKPLIESPFTAQDLVFSPDGQRIAYVSDETGQPEVFLESFPRSAVKRQISVGGGIGPRWRGDGRELYYRSLDDYLMVVTLDESNDTSPGTPERLFKLDSRFSGPDDYDVHPEGQTFVVNMAIVDETVVPMSLLVGWLSEHNAP